MTVRVGAGVSTDPGAANAAVEAARQAAAGHEVDLAFVFMTPHHLDQAGAVVAMLAGELAPRVLLGCVAGGVIAGSRELEDGPALSVWAASLPGAEIVPFHASATPTEDGVELEGFPDPEGADLVALLADPFTFPVGGLLPFLNERYPGLPVVGGLAAGGGRPGAQALIEGQELHSEGAVGALVSGVPVRTVVSQGCMPIGDDAVVTEAEGNVVFELAGKPALERLQEQIAGLPPERRRQAAEGILAGVVIDENRAEYGRGDYLMRGLLGADQETGALAIGDEVRVGQTLRFHMRDADSADEDLNEALRASLLDAKAAGALLFTCNGRGTRMFPAPDHDARALTQALAGPAVGGMFCAGEIGPVGGSTFLHGFTATMAIFLDPEA